MVTDKIKLVIWDMDDTFWDGTISEGPVHINEENINIVKSLVDRGIMNSISSRNEEKVVREKLTELGIWEYFVFPHINWDSKGEQVKEIIEQSNLRAINVLFLDDNLHNLNEAKFLNEGLQIEEPSYISKMLESEFLKGNSDLEHKRLNQFKILEQKSKAREAYNTNEDFLFHSQIKVEIKYDCNNHMERLLDLINRTNQLNYTKKRLSEQELLELISDEKLLNGYVTVCDRYGDYGIVGFFSLIDGKAIHFLFSCRTIGIGVEQWVYKTLGCPEVETVGEVIADLNKESLPPWINQNKKSVEEDTVEEIDKKILIRGGCDLKQIEPYLKSSKISTEFNYLKYHRDHSVFAIDSFLLSENEKKELIENVPFLYNDSFVTQMFSGEYDIVVLSLLMDYTQAVYEYKKNSKICLAWGNFDSPLSVENTGSFSKEELKWFFDNFELKGKISEQQFYNNLVEIRKMIPENTKIVLINGCEINHEQNREPNRYLIHQKMNVVVDRFVSEYENVFLLDMRKIVTGRECLDDNIRHYKRKVYFNMAQELMLIVKNIGGEMKLSHINFKTILLSLKRAVEHIFFR